MRSAPCAGANPTIILEFTAPAARNAGVTYVHANPKYINVNRWDYKDSKGQLLIQNIVGKARTGGGFLEYQVPKAAGGPELPKLTYADGYGAGDKLLAIQAGVYTDDIDAVVFGRAIWIALGGLAGLLIAVLAAFAPRSWPGSSAR